MNTPTPIFLDFDGTLVDTLPGLVTATNDLRRTLGLDEVPAEEVSGWVGGGVDALLQIAVDGAVELPAARAQFYEIYLGAPLLEAKPYAGVDAMLFRLSALPKALVTNKPRRSVELLLKELGWQDTFEAVICPEDADTRKPDPRMLEIAADRMDTSLSARSVLLGDSEFDLQAAHAAGIRAAAAGWGYRSEEQLRACKPHLWFERPSEVSLASLGVQETFI